MVAHHIPSLSHWFELSYGTTTQYSLVGRYGASIDVDTNGVAVGFRSIIPGSAQGDIKAYRYKPGSVDEGARHVRWCRDRDALKIHLVGHVLPAVAIDRKAAIRSKK